jgi:hypothetical protein
LVVARRNARNELARRRRATGNRHGTLRVIDALVVPGTLVEIEMMAAR